MGAINSLPGNSGPASTNGPGSKSICNSVSVSQSITALCHFGKNDLMPVISCLTFCSLFHVIYIPFFQQTGLGHKFVKK